MSPKEQAARDTARETLKTLYGRFGVGFVLREMGVRIKNANKRLKLSRQECQRVVDWAHEMLDEGLQA